MSRIKELQKKVYHVLDKMDDSEKRAKAIAHLHGVSLAAVMIAKKRGLDPELAAMAGLLHDIYAYDSGSYDDHARLGAEYARRILEDMGTITPEETEIIYDAIHNHDSKASVDAPMDEVLKDADVIDHSLNDPTKEVKEHEKERYKKLCEEFGI
ncbi:MAG: HD domain-containing protein [Oscillospiraceae bacterium]|nr:HD domain-containing protein [Oscillospiraceae bacterium]